MAPTEVVLLEEVVFEVAHDEHHGFEQDDRAVGEEVVHDDIDERRVERVGVDGQEALHGDQTQVDRKRVQVVQQLRLSRREQLVDQLDVRAKSQHVRVVVARHQLFDHVHENPKTLFFRVLLQYEKSDQSVEALAVAHFRVPPKVNLNYFA